MLRKLFITYCFLTLSSFGFANKANKWDQDFRDAYYHIYFDLALKDSDKAFRLADSLYKKITVPRDRARTLMLMASIEGKRYKPISALKYVDKALKLAKQNGNNDVLVWGYYYKGSMYRSFGFYKRGNAMLHKAEDLSLEIQDEYLKDEFGTILLKGKAEMAMANHNFKKAGKILLKGISKFEKWAAVKTDAAAILGRLYQILGHCYYARNDLNAAFKTYHTADNLLNKWHTKNTLYTGRVYHKIGDIYLKRNKLDSTKKYLLKSLAIAEAGNSSRFRKKVYQSLKNYYEKDTDLDHFKIYVKKEDSIAKIIERDNKSMISAMDEYPFKDEEKEEANKGVVGAKGTAIIIISSLSLLILAIYFFVKNREKRKKIEDSSKENAGLKQRLNVTFNEVVGLAKNNDPSFLGKFKQVYPDLYGKITNLEVKLTDSEITLCAMIWLKFSTKEIAQFTFVQHKTVQIKKYRLRKKLSLPKGEDLYKWMIEL